MKKSIIVKIASAMLVIPLLFTGCETLDNLGDKVTGLFQNDKKSSDTKTGAEKITKKTDASATRVTPKVASYKVTDNYDEAYSYRTDMPNKTIQTFIKNKTVDSQRITNPDGYIKTVVAKINETGANDFERVKMAHDVICLLVSYDAKNFWSNTVPDQSWLNAVKTKTAVCEGYANLFQKFCSELKIKSQKVSGYARGVGTDISTETALTSNHAWNIVCINECWYLIDCTWDSGYMNGKSSVQSYTTDWLFLKPEYFVYTHLPSDSKNQLIQLPLSIAEFTSLPDFRPKMFELTGEGFSSVKKINMIESCFEKEYKMKEGWTLSYQVNAVGGSVVKNGVWSEKDGGITITQIQFPAAGRYKVTMFYMKDGTASGQSCGQFLVEALEASSIKYPTIYQTKSKNTVLVSPKQIPLIAGETVTFEVYSEDRTFVAVIVGKNFIQLENDGYGNFTGEVEIPKGVKQISIGLSSTGKGSYETLAVFEVK